MARRRDISVLCVVLMMLVSQIHAQTEPTHRADSIVQALKKPMHDTLRVQDLIALAEECYTDNPERALSICGEAKNLSEKANYIDGMTNAYGWLAYLYEQKGQIRSALQYNYKALALARKTGNKKDQSTLLNNIAAIYKDQGKILEALNYHQKSLAIKKQIGDKNRISSSYNNIGLIYASQGKIDEALDYYSRSLRIEEDNRSPEGISTALGNIASVYKDQKEFGKAKEYLLRALKINIAAKNKYATGYTLNLLGALYDEMGDNKSAADYFERALKTREAIGDRQGVANSLRNLGNIYKRLGNITEAEGAFEKSRQIFNELGDKLGLAIVDNLLGEMMQSRGKKNAAEHYFRRSLAIAQELGYPMNISAAAKNLQQLYRDKGDWKQALTLNDVYIRMRDSVQNNNTRLATIRTQFKYDFEQKIRQQKLAAARRLAEERRSQNIQYAMIALGLLIFIVLFLVLSHTVIVTPKMIQFFGVITLLVVFEFINLLLHPMIEHLTHHSTVLTLASLVLIASLLVPLHHRIEHWATAALLAKNKRVRLARMQKKKQYSGTQMTEDMPSANTHA